MNFDPIAMVPVDLNLLLTRRQAWKSVTPNGCLVCLVPSARDEGYWHIAVLDPNSGYTDGTNRPVSPFGVVLHFEGWGIVPGELDWLPDDDHAATDPNPFFV